jgi:hypothetical protein
VNAAPDESFSHKWHEAGKYMQDFESLQMLRDFGAIRGRLLQLINLARQPQRLCPIIALGSWHVLA